MQTSIVSVSFARTPTAEVSAKHDEIVALGWREDPDGRGDPWVATYRKETPEGRGVFDEVVAIMGDYWVDADEITVLLKKASNAAAAS